MDVHCLLVYAVVLLGCETWWAQELEDMFRGIKATLLADRIAECGDYAGKCRMLRNICQCKSLFTHIEVTLCCYVATFCHISQRGYT